ncbi:hypothetical protein Mycch_2415 [Mycolicibacterium chubuense NBB4]|uniref:Uncharacterized protein n=1 Tax=Mycolicibacterium chubuense (strain NBB4) TaxID=710421 RepID=I4BIT1_MYCCN|nr:hypothetical protein [Mycolicibacterium chubuense]AFM17188.1 hypothetical protein Mycch_2415 [Mycolicibacterium chubuense NBB4]
MTALQDWLSISPVKPLDIKAVLMDAFRGRTSDHDEKTPDGPQLMGRGLERC